MQIRQLPPIQSEPIKPVESEYTVKGLDPKYNATWQFFNADSTGNNGVDVVIKDGEISGLVVSNKKSNFYKRWYL